jgi:hypothetical protein
MRSSFAPPLSVSAPWSAASFPNRQRKGLPRAQKPYEPYAEAASVMALAHNVIIRGLNSIYKQGPNIHPKDHRDFIGYATCVCTSPEDLFLIGQLLTLRFRSGRRFLKVSLLRLDLRMMFPDLTLLKCLARYDQI